MNFAVVGVDDRQTCRFDTQQIDRAIENAFDDFGEIRTGVDVVCDLQEDLVDPGFPFLLGIDVGVPIADRDMLGEVPDKIYFIVVPVIIVATVMKSEHPKELKIERYRNKQ